MPEIGRLGIAHARHEVRDTVILDTAGRLTVDDVLMAEVTELIRAIRPVETLLVIDAMVGQARLAVTMIKTQRLHLGVDKVKARSEVKALYEKAKGR